VALDQPVTQAEFGELVGITQQAVNDLVKRGVLTDGHTCQQWLWDYCKRLRLQAAGRDGTDLSTARAALDNAKRIEVELRNAIKQREYAPVWALADLLALVGRQISGALESIVPGIRLRWPDVGADKLKLIEAEVVKARNLAAGITLDRLLDRESETSEEEAA
jgi:phage terminase Nu1 subunit (DNA packaging protein)